MRKHTFIASTHTIMSTTWYIIGIFCSALLLLFLFTFAFSFIPYHVFIVACYYHFSSFFNVKFKLCGFALWILWMRLLHGRSVWYIAALHLQAWNFPDLNFHCVYINVNFNFLQLPKVCFYRFYVSHFKCSLTGKIFVQAKEAATVPI